MPTQGINILKNLVQHRLATIEAKGRLRSLRPLPRTQSRDILDLTHNDYLGFRSDETFQTVARKSAAAWPMGAGASRLLGGEHLIYEELEQEFSAWKNCEASLYFASGYAANEALMSTLALGDVTFFSDGLNHASLIDGLRLARIHPHQKIIFPHNNLSVLDEQLSLSQSELKVVVTESLFSMDGDQAPLSEMLTLCRQHSALLVVDEAHALGVYGEQGSGLLSAHGLSANEVVTINPCGKGMAAAGAFISGPKWLRDYLINTARSFIYSTGASPWLAAGMLATLPLIRAANDRRGHLANLSHTLRHDLQMIGCDVGRSTTHIIPLVLGSEEKSLQIEYKLREYGILARAIRPPTVAKGECRLRFSLHAGIRDVDPVLNALREIL